MCFFFPRSPVSGERWKAGWQIKSGKSESRLQEGRSGTIWKNPNLSTGWNKDFFFNAKWSGWRWAVKMESEVEHSRSPRNIWVTSGWGTPWVKIFFSFKTWGIAPGEWDICACVWLGQFVWVIIDMKHVKVLNTYCLCFGNILLF